MQKYVRNATILVDITAEPHLKDVFYARSRYARCGMWLKTINCFMFTPSNPGLWASNIITGIGCWKKELIYINCFSRPYYFRWLPVMSLFCRIKVGLNEKIRT